MNTYQPPSEEEATELAGQEIEEAFGVTDTLYPVTLLVGVDEVRASMCQQCGNIPQADWLPFWVYDEFGECSCLRCQICNDVYGDSKEPWYYNQAGLNNHNLGHINDS